MQDLVYGIDLANDWHSHSFGRWEGKVSHYFLAAAAGGHMADSRCEVCRGALVSSAKHQLLCCRQWGPWVSTSLLSCPFWVSKNQQSDSWPSFPSVLPKVCMHLAYYLNFLPTWNSYSDSWSFDQLGINIQLLFFSMRPPYTYSAFSPVGGDLGDQGEEKA